MWDDRLGDKGIRVLGRRCFFVFDLGAIGCASTELFVVFVYWVQGSQVHCIIGNVKTGIVSGGNVASLRSDCIVSGLRVKKMRCSIYRPYFTRACVGKHSLAFHLSAILVIVGRATTFAACTVAATHSAPPLSNPPRVACSRLSLLMKPYFPSMPQLLFVGAFERVCIEIVN